MPRRVQIISFDSYTQPIEWQNTQTDLSARWQLISLPKTHLQRVKFHHSHSVETLWYEVLKSFKKQSTRFKSKLCHLLTVQTWGKKNLTLCKFQLIHLENKILCILWIHIIMYSFRFGNTNYCHLIFHLNLEPMKKLT